MQDQQIDRRTALQGGIGLATLALGGCVAPYGSRFSYATQVVPKREFDSATYWVDVLLQETTAQRILPPRAAYNFAGPTVAGFIAANAIVGRYEDNFGIGRGPQGADPQAAYGAAFSTVMSQVCQTPLIGERARFMRMIPDSEAKTAGAEWGRQIGLEIVRRRTHDGSAPNLNANYLGRWKRRADALRWPDAQNAVDRTWAQWQAAGQDVAGAVADPLVSNAGTDFTLLPGSPALALGFQQLNQTWGPRAEAR
jgi:hypothetical protein